MNQTEKTAKKGIPFSLQIVIAVILAIVVGILLGAGNPPPELIPLIKNLKIPTELVFQALEALAAPLIFLVLIDTLVTNSISKKEARNLVFFIAQNTAIAILIGFLVVTILSPGTWIVLDGTASESLAEKSQTLWEIIKGFINKLTPEALLQPLVENNFISLVLIALGFGFVLRRIKIEQESQGKTNFQSLENIIKVLSKAIERILKWVIALLPIAVFGVVANTIAEEGFAPFISFGALIAAVLLALFLQACYYLIRIKFGSWVNPIDFLRGGSEALLFAFFSTSSVNTMPIAWKNLVEKIGLKQESASLGVYLGGNISKDCVAICQVLFTLFVAQILGQNFSLGQYFILFLLSIFCSVCTVGIPGGGIVMMILVFNTVFTNPESARIYIGLIVSVYWFLDMCATVINVMSYMTVSTLLDGKEKEGNRTQQDIIPNWQKEILIWGITILLAVFFGIVLDAQTQVIEYLTLPALLVLKVVVALAVPMFFLVIIKKLITIEIPGTRWRNLLLPLFINTTFAILIGFLVGNLFRPGIWGSFAPLDVLENTVKPTPNPSNIDNFWNVILGIIKNLVPESLIQPLVENNVIQIIVVAFSLGIFLRAIKFELKEQEKRNFQPLRIKFKLNEPNKIDFQPLENVIGVLLEAVKVILRLVIKLLPLAVFGILLKNIAAEGFAPLLSLLGFVLTILVGLFLQACYYLIVIKFGSWVNPFDFLRQSLEGLNVAFSTASSIKTIPDAARVLVEKIGLNKKSAELGTFVGGYFSKDGTIILMVTSVLYVSQMLGQNLSFGQFFFLILTSIFISIGAAGIPNAGLLTLTLVFTAIDIPIDYIAVILVLDWFLDRFYTVINVMGYMTTSLLLDGKNPHSLKKAS